MRMKRTTKNRTPGVGMTPTLWELFRSGFSIPGGWSLYGSRKPSDEEAKAAWELYGDQIVEEYVAEKPASRRLCGVCSWRLLRGTGLGSESPVPGQSSESAATSDSSGRWTCASPSSDPRRPPNAVLAWSRTNGTSYPLTT